MPIFFHRLSLCLTCVLLLHTLPAQSIEDKIQRLSQSISDSERYVIYSDLCWDLAASDPDLSRMYGNTFLSYARKQNNKVQEAQALNDLGTLHLRYGQYDSAMLLFKACEAIRVQEGLEQPLAAVRSKMGVVLMEQGKYLQSLNKHLEAHTIFERLGEPGSIGLSLNNLGSLYEKLGRIDDALRCHHKAIEIAIESKNAYAHYTALGNLGLCYEKQDKLDSALWAYQDARTRMLAHQDYANAASAMNNIGLIYRKQQNYELALQSYSRALEEGTKINDKHIRALAASNIATVYAMQKRWSDALKYSLLALPLAEEIGVRTIRRNCYATLASVYENTGNPAEALKFLRKYEVVKDSLFNEENTRSFAEMQTRFETEQREKEAALAKAELIEQENTNRMQLLLFAILVITGSMAGVVVFQRNQSKQKLKLEAERSRLQKDQFRAVIEAEEQERMRVARELHDGLGQLLSAARLNVSVLDPNDPDEQTSHQTSLTLLDDACQEVRNISHNLMPGTLIRLGLPAALNDLAQKVNVAGGMQVIPHVQIAEESLSKSMNISIFRICQELIANTLKHAKAAQLHIHLSTDAQSLILDIRDDGTGIEMHHIENSTGIGWKNIFSRVSLLNGTITVQKGKDNIGTHTHIRIPLA